MSGRNLTSTGSAAAENELLAQLGLPPSASPEEVDDLHLAVSRYLAAAPSEISGWAHAQAASLDRAYLTLTDPGGLQGSALRSPTEPPAVVPGGPATPPARRDSAAATVAAPEAAAMVSEAASVPETDDEPDPTDLAALYASVTPSAHEDMRPSTARKPAPPKPAAAAPTSLPAASQPAGARSTPWKKVAIGAGGVIVVLALVSGGIALGNSGSQPANGGVAQATPAPTVDPAAVSALMTKLAANPKDTTVLLDLADTYYAVEDYEQAGTFLDKLLAIDPKNVQALLARGAVSFNTGDLTTAEQTWKQVTTIDPKNAEVHYDLGFLYLNQQTPDWAGVQREWNEVIALDPGSDLAKTVQAHLTSLAKASMLPDASPAASGGAPAASPASSPAASPAANVLDLTAKDLAFSTAALSAPADTAFTIRFDNQEAGLPHDVQISDAAGTVVFKGDLVTGPTTVDYSVPALPAGTYTFVCSIHPTMTGTLKVGS